MQQVSLPNTGPTKRYHVEIVVFAHGRTEVESTLDCVFAHHRIVVLVPNLLLHQTIAVIFLCVGADFACELGLDSREVHYFGLLILCIGIGAYFAPTDTFCLVGRREYSRREVLGVNYADLFSIYQDKDDTLRQEEALVNAVAFTDVETVKF